MSSLQEPELLPAIYRVAELAEHRGNPLIEALPPFRTAEELLEHFGTYPQFDERERKLPAASRMLAVSRLNGYLEPLVAHFDVVEQIPLLIHSGYTYRNPTRPEYRKALVDLYRKSMAGKICPLRTSGPSTAPSFSLFGVSGAGKSSVVERTLSFYPQAIAHPQYGFSQVVWLKLDCPLDGSLKQLLNYFLYRIDMILGTEHTKMSKRATVDELLVDVARVAAQHHLGLLVVDEIQNLLEASGVGPAKMLNFFVTFANEVKIPIVVLGTPKAQRMLEPLFREARRVSDHGSVSWDRMELGDEWEFFLSELSQYQWTLTPVDISEAKLSKAIYFHTLGIRALVVRLFQLSQIQAIRDKSERISVALINKVVSEKFSLLSSALTALRSGDRDQVEKYEDLLTAGLSDLHSQVATVSKQTAVDEIRSNRKRIRAERVKTISNLISLGVDQKDAQRMVDDLFSSDAVNEDRRQRLMSKSPRMLQK